MNLRLWNHGSARITESLYVPSGFIKYGLLENPLSMEVLARKITMVHFRAKRKNAYRSYRRDSSEKKQSRARSTSGSEKKWPRNEVARRRGPCFPRRQLWNAQEEQLMNTSLSAGRCSSGSQTSKCTIGHTCTSQPQCLIASASRRLSIFSFESLLFVEACGSGDQYPQIFWLFNWSPYSSLW